MLPSTSTDRGNFSIRRLMHEQLFELMAARRGHFLLESGHHGELWLDVDRLFIRPDRVRRFAAALAGRIPPYHVDAVCGPLTGGAFLAQMVAEELGVAFVYADRVVQPAAAGLFPITYPIPAEFHDFVCGRRVAVVNDVNNAGSAVRGALASLHAAGAQPVALAALLVLGDAAAELAASAGIPLETLAHAPNRIWPPANCPFCAAHVPLDAVAGGL
jgi:orotate phosphoribosyltransferase